MQSGGIVGSGKEAEKASWRWCHLCYYRSIILFSAFQPAIIGHQPLPVVRETLSFEGALGRMRPQNPKNGRLKFLQAFQA